MKVTLPDGFVVEVEFAVTSYGSPDSYWEQGDPPELEVEEVWSDEYGVVTPSDAEYEAIDAWLCEHFIPDPYDDIVDYP